RGPTAPTAEACVAAARFAIGHTAGADIAKRTVPPAAARSCAATAARSRAGTAAARSRAGACSAVRAAVTTARKIRHAITATGAAATAKPASVAGTPGLQPLLAAATTEIHAIVGAATQIVVAELLAYVIVAVSDALAMLGIVLPVTAATRSIARVINVDVVVIPIDRAVPGIAARHPAPHGVASAECQPGGEQAAGNVAGRRKVIGRIAWGPTTTVDDGRIVIGHVNRVGIFLLDDDDLFVLNLFDADILLFVALQLVIRLRFGTQALDRIHDVGLLSEHRIAELLRPVELVVHHGEYAWRRHQRFYAVVP